MSENIFSHIMGKKEEPDTRTKREKLAAEEKHTLEFLSPEEQEEYLKLLEEYEEKYPNVFAEIEDKPQDPKFARIEELRKKSQAAWESTPEYKNTVEEQK